MNNGFRDFFKHENKYNPFSLKYSEKEVKQLYDEKLEIENIDSLYAVSIIGKLCENYFNKFGEVSNIYKGNKHRFIKDVLAEANRETTNMSKELSNKLIGRSEIRPTDVYKQSPLDGDPDFGHVEYTSANEAYIDGANYYLKHGLYCISNNKMISDSEKLDYDLKQIITASVFQNMFKEIFEDAVWNRGYFQVNKDNFNVDVKFYSEREQLCYKAGHIRYQKNVTSFLMSSIGEGRDGFLYKLYKKKRKGKTISKVRLGEHGLVVNFKNGFSGDEFDNGIAIKTSLIMFYPFMFGPSLKNGLNIDLLDVMNVFCWIQHLISTYKGEFSSSDNTKNQAYISHGNLVNYIRASFKLNLKQINGILDILSVDATSTNRIDIWANPIIKLDKIYYFCYLPLQVPNSLFIVDSWLESSSIDMKVRGDLLEDHLNQVLTKSLSSKRCQFEIVKGKKSNKRTKDEFESDIILIFEKYVYVIECKCVKYPLDARSRSNSYSSLEYGTNQVKKTISALTDGSCGKILFSKIEGKVIKGLVCTNFPFLSGHSIDGVPIVDAFLINSYFEYGKFTNKKEFIDKGKLVSSELLDEVIYFHDYASMEENFYRIMQSPPPVEQVINELFLNRSRKTVMSDGKYDFYVEEPVVKK